MWHAAEGYERFMGRWSALLADDLVARAVKSGAATGSWLDVGCGPGAVIAAALRTGVGRVTGVEPSAGFAAGARKRFEDQPVEIVEADGEHLPDGPFDVVLSNLVLNFTPDPVATLRAMAAAGGLGIVSVWDYDDERSFLYRCHAAIERVLGHRSPQDERSAFEVCTVDGLAGVAARAGWRGTVESVDVPTRFVDHDDLWEPFLEGIGPAGAWLVTQDHATRAAVREQLILDVFDGDGPAELAMRALVVTTAAE